MCAKVWQAVCENRLPQRQPRNDKTLNGNQPIDPNIWNFATTKKKTDHVLMEYATTQGKARYGWISRRSDGNHNKELMLTRVALKGSHRRAEVATGVYSTQQKCTG